MSAQFQPAAAPAPPAEQAEGSPSTYRGRFKKGFDPRRHKFTQAECIDGFWAAIESVAIRYPDAVDSAGRHITCNFLQTMLSRKPKRVN
jgi:hypothetical protein